MTTPVELTANVERSELSDGRCVYVGTIAEVPGIFTQAESQRDALAELIAIAQNLHHRVGLPVIGLRTPAVRDWRWTTVAPDGVVASFGSAGAGNAATLPVQLRRPGFAGQEINLDTLAVG